MDPQNYKTSLVNEEILVLQMGGTIDKDFRKQSDGGEEMEIGEPAVKRILNKVKPFRSILVRVETIAKKSGRDLTQDDRSLLIETIVNCKNRRILITHGSNTLDKSTAGVALALTERGIEDKAVVFTGASTPERFRDSDADLNVGVALGFLQNGITGVWVSFGGLVLPWNRAHKQRNGQFVPKRTKSVPVLV